jgi:hypothetical protein
LSDEQDPADKEHFGEADLGEAQAENAPNDPEMLIGAEGDDEVASDEELTEVPAFEPAPTDALEIAAEEDAAAEAGAIGGISGEEGLPEAQRPLAEAGEGEAEGFEQAEEALVENASHGDGGADPLGDRFTPEEAAAEGLSTYGEADQVEVSEDDLDESDKE